MRRTLTVACLLVASFARAEEESLQTKKERLLAEPFLKQAPWLTDYERAHLAEAGKKCAEMKHAGRIPTETRTVVGFYAMILEYAESAGDATLFEEALGFVKGSLGDGPEAQAWAATQEERL